MIGAAARADYTVAARGGQGVLTEDAIQKYIGLMNNIAGDEDNWLHTTNAGQLLLLVTAESVDEEHVLDTLGRLWDASQLLKSGRPRELARAKESIAAVLELHASRLKTNDGSWNVDGQFYDYVMASVDPALAKRNRHDLSSGGHGSTPRTPSHGGKEYPINNVFVTRFGEKHTYDPSAYEAISNILSSKTAKGHGMKYSPTYGEVSARDSAMSDTEAYEMLPDSMMRRYGEVVGISPG